IVRVGRTHLVLAAGHDTRGLEPSPRTSFGGLVGRSVPMRKVFAVLERAASATATVLLAGETGTGKELAARAIHDQGPRAAGPFLILDCGALAPAVLPSELFGHARGAFTGASRNRAGILEQAHGGTVFLDEIGDLPLALQPALLRVCDRGQFTR